jgi:hypothetical protein
VGIFGMGVVRLLLLKACDDVETGRDGGSRDGS